ncbi:FAD-dependent oxidoreductase [Nocardia sp. NPDC049220]|uniref:NAD(P)/FAD-dependent oxidoreductase n=1 Tax=Nocardia sp. NPDC049220 TaxID=3155273 RepID=UPI003407162D
MVRSVGCVVVGGGIAGLMVAARLAAAGWKVVVLERGLLGSGATTSNHGIVHSGALYARWHPEIVSSCRQAQAGFAESFPECVVGAESCWYLGHSETMQAYEALWHGQGIAYHDVDPSEIGEVVARHHDVVGRAVEELVIDTRALLVELATRCVALGVEIAVATGAQRIVIDDGHVRAVDTAREHILTPNVVVCAGIGTGELLERSGSTVAAQLSSRLEMMTAYPGTVTRPIVGLEFSWPALAPAAVPGVVLASRYGGVQRRVTGPGRWPVPAAEATALDLELTEWLVPGVIDHSGAQSWVCSKTEYTRVCDQWGTAPDYAAIDHASENITGLRTLLPGKMTLSLHGSRDIAASLLGAPQPLPIACSDRTSVGEVAELVSLPPWAAHREVEAR